MKKQLLKERFQQLAGIKPLIHEFYPDDTPDEPGYTGSPAYGDEGGMAPRVDDNLEPIKKGKMVHLNEYFEDIGKMKIGDTTVDVGYAKMDLVPGEK